MSEKTKTLTIRNVKPETLKVFSYIAKLRGVTQGELFHTMVTSYFLVNKVEFTELWSKLTLLMEGEKNDANKQ